MVFNGIKYRRYPDAKTLPEQRYYVAGIADRQNGAGRLHQDIWRHHNGPIPDGYHIHHADGDHNNNDPSNLVALTEAEHQAHHAGERVESGFYRTPERLALLERIRPMTTEWHSSPEGIEWHRQHGRDVWAKRPITKDAWEGREPADYTCEHCGKSYWTRAMQGGKFCSNACKSAARRAANADDEERTCTRCGSAFRANRYSKTKHCSRSCSAQSRADEQAETSRRMWANAPTVETTCESCGRSWTARINGTDPGRFCSTACRGKARYEAAQFPLVCEQCGSEFSGKKPTIRFCGKTCSALHREALKRGRRQ